MPKTDANSSKALTADLVGTLYDLKGRGLKVGVISDSFDRLGGASADKASGDLPSDVTVVREGMEAGDDDEGRAMIELAYRIAPGASYYFATGSGGLAAMAAAVTALQDRGCDIIIDDLSYGGAEGVYQVGTVLDKAIAAAVRAGVSYFSSAGNDGKAFYESGFTPLAVALPGILGGQSVVANDFGNGSPYLSVTIPSGRTLDGLLAWAQPFASIGSSGRSAANSLALYLLDASGAVVGSAVTDQAGHDPVQGLKYTNPGSSTAFRLVVVQNGGTVPGGQLFKLMSENGGIVINDPNANRGSGNIYGHELLAVQNSVGAVSYLKTPAFGTSASIPTDFTSVGPGMILFDGEGNLLATPVDAKSPDFSAPQGTNTAVPGFAPFNGTSASAPNAGAVAALALEGNRGLTPAQVTALMAQSAIPMVSLVPDTGAGLIQARAMVQLAVASAGARWTMGGGGNWTNQVGWSTGAAPTAAGSALVGDDLGAFSGRYTLVANTSGLVSGSLAVGAGAGSSATVSITTGGGLTVGGSNAANPTAGDLLVGSNGVLAMSGGTLGVGRSLNTNNGTITITGGTVSAGDYWQNAGSFQLGGGGAAASVTLTGDGLTQLGGSLTLSARGTLQATKATVSSSSFVVGAGAAFISAAALAFDSAMASVLAGGTVAAALVTLATTSADSILTVAGTLTDSGTLTGSGAASRVVVQDGGVVIVGDGTSNAQIGLQGNARLVLSSTDRNILVNGYTATVSGLGSGLSQVDFSGLAYEAAATVSYSEDTGRLDILGGGGQYRAALMLDTSTSYAAGFTLAPDAGNGTVLRAAACFARGTLIETEGGEVPVEHLVIGQPVRTVSGALRPIRWIGRRSYAGAFAAGNPAILPVTMKAGALGDGLPRRDLTVSPQHAMLLDGVLVPAIALLNGHSITQTESVAEIDYVHVELDTHDALLAEGAASESFVDDNSRGMFQNAAEFHALHPGAARVAAIYCAPRLDHSAAVEAIRARLADLARSALDGRLDVVTREGLSGWAIDPAFPAEAVRLVIRVDGAAVATVMADAPRPDVAAAGFGTGHQGLLFAFDPPLSPWQDHVISVERHGDGALLARPVALAAPASPTRTPAVAEHGLRGRLDEVTHRRIHGWAFDPAAPLVPVPLVLSANGVELGRVVANRHREDLVAAGFGVGRHAFDMLVPGGLSPLTDQVIEVRREIDGAALPGSPFLLPATAGFEPALQDAVTRAVDGAAAHPARHEAATFLRHQAERLDHLGAIPLTARHPGRRRALVIDARIPRRSRDAGSCALLSHMAALQSLGYDVFFVAAAELDRPDAEAALDGSGAHWCGYPHHASIEEALRRRGGGLDLVYLHGEGIATRYAGLVRAYCGRARLIYGVADLHHLRLERQAVVEDCPQLRAESRGTAVREFTAAWAADAVLTHSAVEAEIIRRAVPQAEIHVVPWAVPARPRGPGLRGRRGVGFLGHFGHAPNRDAARVLTEAVMPLVWAADPSIGCVIAGSDMPPGLLCGPDPRITLLGQVESMNELFDQVRVMAAPLRFGAGIKGKVLDSMAAGVPCVLSETAAEGLGLTKELAGLVGRDPAAVASCILRLHADDVAWRRTSAAGLSFMRSGYSQAAVIARLRPALGDHMEAAAA